MPPCQNDRSITKILRGEAEELGAAVCRDGHAVDSVVADNDVADRLPIGGGTECRRTLQGIVGWRRAEIVGEVRGRGKADGGLALIDRDAQDRKASLVP